MPNVQLSILLPAFNNACAMLVNDIHRQCMAEERLMFEILVAEDGSTNPETVETNSAIGALENCRHIVRRANVGRSAIRNYLAKEARYAWLLFIDSDIAVDHDFINRYVVTLREASHPVVCGGCRITGEWTQWKNNLRFCYEKHCEPQHSAEKRAKHPHHSFRTLNFAVRREVIINHPFNETIRGYGYEDVLFGKELQQAGISICHTDNAVIIDDFESNLHFVQKTEEAMRTLHQIARQAEGYSGLLTLANRLRGLHLMPLIRLLHKWVSPAIRHNLTGNRPYLCLFNIYRLLFLIEEMAKDTK